MTFAYSDFASEIQPPDNCHTAQPVGIQKYRGMGEAFPEYLRYKYSLSRNRFPDARNQPPYRDPSPMK